MATTTATAAALSSSAFPRRGIHIPAGFRALHHAHPALHRRCPRIAPLQVVDDSKEVETAVADGGEVAGDVVEGERSQTDKLVDGMDFGELCNDFECISSPYVEATARQLARDILELREDNRAFNCYAVTVKYKDPVRTFVGREKYKRPLWITKALENPTVTVQEMSMQSTSNLTIKWTLRGKPKNPLFATIGGDLIVRVTSQFVLNQISGQVLEQVDSWDLSASSPPAQAYFWLSRRVFSTVEAGKDTIEAAKGTASRLSTNKDENLEAYPDPSGDPTKFFQRPDDGLSQDVYQIALFLAVLYFIVHKLRDAEHHDHELTLTAGNERFQCDGCKEYGYQRRYTCENRRCRGKFHLHEACAKKLGDHYQDPFKSYSLVFHRSLPSTVKDVHCHGCGGNVNGYTYMREIGKLRTWLKRGMVLHPCCAALPMVIEAEGGIRLQLRRKLRSRCCKCGHVKLGDKRHTWGYVSDGGGTTGDVAVQIHVACANDLFHEDYENTRLQQRNRLDRLKARLVDMLTKTTKKTTRTGGRMILPKLPANAPEPEPEPWTVDSAVVQALLWAICTVGSVITGSPILPI
uniref:Uncharacterized protein n=1 Tax=Leersia perrieri TaxID=77586 RepID=A0A0D9V9E1_9ORYZ